MIMLYNPAHQRSDQYVQLKVNRQSYKVEDKQGNMVDSDVICPSHFDRDNCDLYFMADIDGL